MASENYMYLNASMDIFLFIIFSFKDLTTLTLYILIFTSLLMIHTVYKVLFSILSLFFTAPYCTCGFYFCVVTPLSDICLLALKLATVEASRACAGRQRHVPSVCGLVCNMETDLVICHLIL